MNPHAAAMHAGGEGPPHDERMQGSLWLFSSVVRVRVKAIISCTLVQA